MWTFPSTLKKKTTQQQDFWHVELSSRKGKEFSVGKTSRCYLGISEDGNEI